MSLIRKSDVKNHLSTRTGETALPVGPDIDTGASGNGGDGSQEAGKEAAVTRAELSGEDESASSASRAGKPAA